LAQVSFYLPSSPLICCGGVCASSAFFLYKS
jgi:hypothetical protein